MKKFLIVGNMNAITYKDVFPHFKDNELWLGETWVKEFIQPDGTVKPFGNICWFTNVEHSKRYEPLDLCMKYNPEEYPKYDNYDAIEVSKTCDIPADYDGVMGVPITFLDKYCPDQFELVGYMASHGKEPKGIPNEAPYLNGNWLYKRILIRRKK